MIGPKGIMFNGFDLSPWLTANVSRPLLPPVEVQADSVPGMDGTRFRSAKLGELPIPVDVRLKAGMREDIAGLRHALASMLMADAPAPLVLGDDPRRYHLAVLDGSTDLDSLWFSGRTTLNFRACDPVAYGESRRGTLKSGVLRVRGTWRTYPVVSITPPKGSYWKIENAATGDFVRVNATFSGSARLVVDCAERHCTLNGANADKYLTLDSDYLALEPGENKFTVSGGSPSFEWSERWL